MDPSSSFIVPTIIDVPELIVTNEDIDYDDTIGFTGSGANAGSGFWSNKLQFLSSSLSYTIGLGNLWRFPYLCYKHAGGAYLIAYTSIVLTIGMPLLLMELAFGQYANEGPITIWRISPAFEGIGYSMCLISSLIAIYYNLINTWIMQYLFATITFGPLPWSSCDNSWNSRHCFYKPEENFEIPSGNSSNCSPALGARISNSTTTPTTSASTIVVVDMDSASGNPISISSNNNNTNTSGNILMALSNGSSSSSSNCSTTISGGGGGNSSSLSSAFEFDKIFNVTNEVFLPTNEYFHKHVLGITSKAALLNDNIILGSWNWNLIFGLTLAWLIVFIVLLKNLRPWLSSLSLSMLTSPTNSTSSLAAQSRLSKRLALISLIMPHLALFALLVRSLTLPGSGAGVAYYFKPEWDRLQNIDIWADAVTQVFYSLAPCWGGIITLANMNKFHNNFHSNTMLLVLINYVTSLMAGLMAFGTLGYMSTYSGIKIDQLVDVGIGFVFMVYPEALNQMPLTNLNAFTFFAILLLIGLTSQLTVIETVITTIVDTWPHKLRYRRPLVMMILCTTMLLFSLPLCFGNGFYLLQTIDSFAGTLSGMLIGILELVAIAWVYGVENFMQDIDDMISVHRNLFPSRAYWYFMWRYLTPSLLFAILLFSLTDYLPVSYRDIQPLPSWMLKFGWTLTIVCAAVILLVALIRFILSPGNSFADKISYLCRPSEDWAPSSYISGPKLINRHQMLDDSDLHASRGAYSECMVSRAGSGSGVGGGGGGTRGSSRNDDGAGGGGCSSSGLGDNDGDYCATVYTSKRGQSKMTFRDQDMISNQSTLDDDDDDDDERDNGDEDEDDDNDDNDDDLKVVDGRTSYIIAEEEDDDDNGDGDDTDTGLITTETNV